MRTAAAPFPLLFPLLFSRPSSHPVVRLAIVTAALLASVAVTHAAPLVATQITAENYATHHVGGPDSDAGIGDWFLSNGTICATITAPEHESAITPRGGVLTDLGHCGAANDQWIVLQPMLNLSQSHVVPIDEVKAELGPKRASIHTRAVFEGVELITTYSVNHERPNAIDVSTRAKRIAEGDALFSVGQILLHTSGQTPVFSLNRVSPEDSAGFVFPETDRRSITSLLAALISSDLTVLVGAEGMPPVSYGLEELSAQVTEAESTEALGTFSVSGEHFTFTSALARPPWIGGTDAAPSLLQLAQIPFMDIEDEQVVAFDQRIHLGARSDVASITDRVWNYGALIRGSVDDPAARVHIDRISGAPMTEIRPDPDGRFQLRLPKGEYRVRALAPGGREAVLVFSVLRYGEEQQLADIVLGSPGRIRLPRSFTGRLTFLPTDNSGPLVFGDNLLGQQMGPQRILGGLEAPWLNLAGSPLDPEIISVAPGQYQVIASRGPEYDITEIEIDVEAGSEITLALASLTRVAPTPGWIAADYHVHSGESFDSGLPQNHQIIAFAASGAEVLVATEHDRVFDPRPAMSATGLSSQLVSITGVEATSSYEGGDSPYATGHLNAFPMVPEPQQFRGGTVNMEGRRLRDVLADLRALPSSPFIQMNHPRPSPEETEGDTYFSHLGVAGVPYDPTLSLSEMPNKVLVEPSPDHGGSDLDYHGVELMNAESLLRYRRTRADWFSLLLQGERIIGTANSDSHMLSALVGLPRTYVAQADDTLSAFDEATHVNALRAGRAWGSTGPLLSVQLEEAGLGDLYAGQSGTLTVSVDAAPWVPVATWRAYVNGELVHSAPISRGETVSLPLVFPADAFVTVEVEGPIEGRYADVYPGFTPFAFTNPIFVDADANGRFDAPGLPENLPQTLTDPDRADESPTL